MNIQRFKWPVVIAAGLHGALFVFSPTPPVIAGPPDKPRVDSGPPSTIEWQQPEDPETDGGAAGAPTPLHGAPDVTPPDGQVAPFTVPVEPYSPPGPEIARLEPRIPGGGGLDGGLGFGPPPRIVSLPNLDRVPRAMAQTEPRYPESMRVSGTAGSVTVEFVVGPDGRVERAEAVRWTHRDFIDPAVRAVLRWRFEPGTVKGLPVRFRMAVPIEFRAER